MMTQVGGGAAQLLASRGWAFFDVHPGTRRWAEAALPLAIAALGEPRDDWRCGGTWCVGLDALANGPDGAVNGIPLAGKAIDAARALYGPQTWHRAQLSAVLAGYPKPSGDETDAAFRFRVKRDAAHVDGLLPVGVARQRRLKEPHAFILGLPLNSVGQGSSPLVIWEGSHVIMRQALGNVLGPQDPVHHLSTDLTEAYQAARRQVFADCRRVELPMKPGEAILIHRLALHGVAPWTTGAAAPTEGRIIAYFRPLLADSERWLNLP